MEHGGKERAGVTWGEASRRLREPRIRGQRGSIINARAKAMRQLAQETWREEVGKAQDRVSDPPSGGLIEGRSIQRDGCVGKAVSGASSRRAQGPRVRTEASPLASFAGETGVRGAAGAPEPRRLLLGAPVVG